MSRKWKCIVAGAAALAGAMVTYRVYLALESDETRIRRMVRRMEEAFNEGEAGTLAGHLARDFVHAESRLDRNEVRLFLFGFFRNHRNRTTGDLDYQAGVEPGDVEVNVSRREADEGEAGSEEDPSTAELAVTVRFTRRGDGGKEARPAGVMLFTATLRRVEGEWLIQRASYRSIEGRLPF